MIAPAKTRVTTPFGWVEDYPLNKGSYPGYGTAPSSRHGFHTGVDYSHSPDNKIYMPETGIVQLNSWNGTDYNGNHIIVEVDNRRHFMGHIKAGGFLVKNGTTVKMGTPIAIMGDTGYAQGVHLHWGLRVNGKIVDGRKYVTQEDEMYDGKTAEEWYKIANDWHQRADDRQKLINPTPQEVKDLFQKVLGRQPNSEELNRFSSQRWLSLTSFLAESVGPGAGDQAVKDRLFDQIKAIFGK